MGAATPIPMRPNDSAAMQTLDRDGVQFDMCPTCRGVWLDRGELEKLMAAAVDGARAVSPAAPPPHSQPWGGQPSYRDDRGYRDDRRRDDDYRYKKKKRDSIFDIFD